MCSLRHRGQSRRRIRLCDLDGLFVGLLYEGGRASLGLRYRQDGASAENNNSGSIRFSRRRLRSAGDGTVYALARLQRTPTRGCRGGAFAISGGAAGGSRSGTSTRRKALVSGSFRRPLPRNTSSSWRAMYLRGHQNFQVYDKSSGNLVDERHVNSGSYGGVPAQKRYGDRRYEAVVTACASISPTARGVEIFLCEIERSRAQLRRYGRR